MYESGAIYKSLITTDTKTYLSMVGIAKEFIEKAQERIGDFKRLQKAGLINLQGQFFPSVHYPPITMYPPIEQKVLFEGYKNPTGDLFDIYVHIPFCIRYCAFCHYPVKIGASPEEKDVYLRMLEKEMRIYMRTLGVKKLRARSILIGGGTPTYISAAQLENFLASFVSYVDLSCCSQFSYDVDPTTLTDPDGPARIKIMRAHGVDRLTIGIQSFDEDILKVMNRAHNKDEALRAIRASQEAGFKVNIEFIYGYYNQTLKEWIDTLRQAVDTGVDEIQLYRLKIIPYGDHEGTVLKKFFRNPIDFPATELPLAMKSIAISYLSQQGYHENLRRVFSRTPQDFSRYADNQCCGLLDEAGFGLTAFSSLHDRFALNTMDLQKYYALIDKGRLPVDRGLVRDKNNQMRWAIILPLKNRRVHKKYYQQLTGISLDEIFREKIENLKRYGLLYEDDKILELTDLGSFFADEVCHQFHHPSHMPFTQSAYSEGDLNPYNS